MDRSSPSAAGNTSSSISGSPSESESENVGTTPNGRRKVTAHKLGKGDPTVQGETDSNSHRPAPSGFGNVKPVIDQQRSIKSEDSAGTDYEFYRLDGSPPAGNPRYNRTSRFSQSTPDSRVEDDDDVLSITTDFGEGDSYIEEDPQLSEAGRWMPGEKDKFRRQPEVGTAFQKSISENTEIAPPSEQFPVPVKTSVPESKTSRTDDKKSIQSLSIEGGNDDSDPAVKPGGSVSIESSIESGDKTSKKLFQRVLGAIKKVLNVAKNNPLWTGFLICSAIFLATFLTGHFYVSIVFAICALALLGCALGVSTHNTYFGHLQNPSQTNSGQNPNNGQNPNPQNPAENNTPTDSQKSTAKTESDSSRHPEADDRNERPVTRESPPPSASNSKRKLPVKDGKGATVTTQTVEEADNGDLAKNVEKFLGLINENFTPFANKIRAPEHLYRHSREPGREVDESTSKEVAAAVVGLCNQFRHIADQRDAKGSDTIQRARMTEVEMQTYQLMVLIEPSEEFIEELTNKFYKQFPDPDFCPDPNAPATTIGYMRKRFQDYSENDLQRKEFFDLLIRFIRTAKDYRRKGKRMGDWFDQSDLEG